VGSRTDRSGQLFHLRSGSIVFDRSDGDRGSSVRQIDTLEKGTRGIEDGHVVGPIRVPPGIGIVWIWLGLDQSGEIRLLRVLAEIFPNVRLIQYVLNQAAYFHFCTKLRGNRKQ